MAAVRKNARQLAEVGDAQSGDSRRWNGRFWDAAFEQRANDEPAEGVLELRPDRPGPGVFPEHEVGVEAAGEKAVDQPLVAGHHGSTETQRVQLESEIAR